jgi:branched-chain amino acid transport system substrate-binding protein
MKTLCTIIMSCLLVSLAAAGAFAADEPYRIGAIFAVTGPASWLGEPQKNTVKMLEAQINAAGGINGRKIEVIVEDNLGEEAKTVLAFKKLVDRDKVVAIIGPSRSGSAMAIKPLAERSKVPVVACAAAEAIVKPVDPWVFKTAQNDADAARSIFDKARSMGIKKMAIISSTDGFGAAGRGQLQTIAPEYGISIVADETYGPTDTDMTAQLTKIKGTDAQAIINWSIVPAQTTVLRNRTQLGITIPFFQSHGFGNIKYAREAGAAADGVLFPQGRILAVDTVAADHPQKAVIAQYKKDYEAQFKTDVSAFGGYASDSLMLVVDALKTVGGDRAKIRDHIENRKNFIGVSGVFNFSPENHVGLGQESFEMLTVKDSNFIVAQ